MTLQISFTYNFRKFANVILFILKYHSLLDIHFGVFFNLCGLPLGLLIWLYCAAWSFKIRVVVDILCCLDSKLLLGIACWLFRAVWRSVRLVYVTSFTFSQIYKISWCLSRYSCLLLDIFQIYWYLQSLRLCNCDEVLAPNELIAFEVTSWALHRVTATLSM